MHLVEKYALACGLKIGKPFIDECFFPVSAKKYIVVHPSSGMESKNYNYYNDAIASMMPLLKQNDIEIVQIGSREDPPLSGCIHLQGSTTLRQCAYIIKNSLLVFGNDSFSAHMASGYGVKTVTLYGCSPSDDCYPYWTKDAAICLEPDRRGEKPSFSPQEESKVVNRIDPFLVAKNILSELGIKNSLDEVESIYIGDNYHHKIIEVVPDFNPLKYSMDKAMFNIRMDYHFNEENLFAWGANHRIAIITDKPINPKILKSIKGNLDLVTYSVTTETKPEDLRSIENVGIKLATICYDLENIKKIRLNLIDWKIEEEKVSKKEDYDFAKEISNEMRYVSSKILLAKGKKYYSKAAWAFDIPDSGQNDSRVIDCPEFWEEVAYFRIYSGLK